MNMLISKTELDSKKSRDLIPLECLQCKKTHYRTKNIILRILNGNLKGTMKGCFCSRKCCNQYNQNRQTYKCAQCEKNVERCPSDISGKNIFCCQSCAAKFNSKSRIIIKKCLNCNKEFNPTRGSKGKYCSHICSAMIIQKNCYNKIENGIVDGHSRSTLRSYLKHKRGNKCEICGITEWQGIPLVVIIDHINGNPYDNKLENLRLICSNCDANLPTYKSKNKGNGRSYRRKLVGPLAEIASA